MEKTTLETATLSVALPVTLRVALEKVAPAPVRVTTGGLVSAR